MMNSDQMLEVILDEARSDCDDLNVGENISPIPQMKIIFDGYGETEDGEEDLNSESYAVFIHKFSVSKDFAFPEHDVTPWGLVHRSDEELCLYAWYNNELKIWTLPDEWSNYTNDSESAAEYEEILRKLYELHYEE